VNDWCIDCALCSPAWALSTRQTNFWTPHPHPSARPPMQCHPTSTMPQQLETPTPTQPQPYPPPQLALHAGGAAAVPGCGGAVWGGGAVGACRQACGSRRGGRWCSCDVAEVGGGEQRLPGRAMGGVSLMKKQASIGSANPAE